ncbi:hypothetical protein [Paraflavitalea pollutisoli]|uniref:hypothetical protein n=1 Tax=Paraflavitalea pollutisoli TaxID=3034143 RepID=UPI0023EC73C1|nr:hypothetical protein [Paraflavitalea sp. H1-2-19X]
MTFKLTEKEIQALSKKVAAQKTEAINAKNKAAIKAKMPQAKMIMTTIQALPEPVRDYLTDHRYSSQAVNQEAIARVLAKVDLDTTKVSADEFEADIVLAAHGCTSLSQLCKKLKI